MIFYPLYPNRNNPSNVQLKLIQVKKITSKDFL